MSSKIELHRILTPYNPWWDENTPDPESIILPTYRREIFDNLYSEIKDSGFSISIIGPRRVGKSTIMRQLIDQLLKDGIPPTHILRYQLDDPYFIAAKDQGELFELILDNWEDLIGTPVAASKKPLYCFLDEVQRFPRWELYIKKLIDLKRPILFILSGSASTTIFRSSLESLLGRVKDHHLSTFAFSELLVWQKPTLKTLTEKCHIIGDKWLKSFNYEDLYSELNDLKNNIGSQQIDGEMLERHISVLLGEYFMWGGFPQVREMNSVVDRQSYLLQNHIEKVVREDLMLIRNIKNPEKIEKLFLYLINQTGNEFQETGICSQSGLSLPLIGEYLNLLGQTELINFISKFKKKKIVKKTTQKVYATDLALRNASLKYTKISDISNEELGKYAETLVYKTLSSWPGILDVTYYRERREEVDFIINTGRIILPIEVKYTLSDARVPLSLIRFMTNNKLDHGIIVTKDQLDFVQNKYLFIPLRMFLLLFRTNSLR